MDAAQPHAHDGRGMHAQQSGGYGVCRAVQQRPLRPTYATRDESCACARGGAREQRSPPLRAPMASTHASALRRGHRCARPQKKTTPPPRGSATQPTATQPATGSSSHWAYASARGGRVARLRDWWTCVEPRAVRHPTRSDMGRPYDAEVGTRGRGSYGLKITFQSCRLAYSTRPRPASTVLPRRNQRYRRHHTLLRKNRRILVREEN